jgi:CheY-like chemotaxis protein
MGKGGGMSATILIADGQPINLKLASRALEFQGYRVLQAANAEGAQAVLAQARPALILMDLALPGMDGLTLTRRLKAEPATKGIPIVAMTAFAMKGDAAKALAAGCDGYLSKPIDARKLAGQVAGWLKLAGLKAPTPAHDHPGDRRQSERPQTVEPCLACGRPPPARTGLGRSGLGTHENPAARRHLP